MRKLVEKFNKNKNDKENREDCVGNKIKKE